MPENEPVDLKAVIKGMPDSELPLFTKWLIMERYRVDAGALQMPGGDFLPIDDQEIQPFLTEKFIAPSRFDPKEVGGRLARMGFWGGNDGTVTFVGSDGRCWVGFGSDENMDALESAGYKNAAQYAVVSVNNIMNSGYKFTNPQLQQQWEEMEEKAFHSRGKKSGVRELEDGKLVFEMTPEEIEKQAARYPELHKEARPNASLEHQAWIVNDVTFSVNNPDRELRFGWNDPTGPDELRKAEYAACLLWADQNGFEAEPLTYNRSESRWETRFTKKDSAVSPETAEIVEEPESVTIEKIILDPAVKAQLELNFNELREAYTQKPEENAEKLVEKICGLLNLDDEYQTAAKLIGEREYIKKQVFDLAHTLLVLPPEQTSELFANSESLRKNFRQKSKDPKGEIIYYFLDDIYRESGTKIDYNSEWYKKQEEAGDKNYQFLQLVDETPPPSVEDLSQALADLIRLQITANRIFINELQKSTEFLNAEAGKNGIDLFTESEKRRALEDIAVQQKEALDEQIGAPLTTDDLVARFKKRQDKLQEGNQ